jgi:hypothetical protein
VSIRPGRTSLLTRASALALAACAAFFAFVPTACARPDAGSPQEPARTQPSPAQSQAPASPAPETLTIQEVVPARLEPEDVAKLRWIEGSWRGTGDTDKPFYERYRVESDAIIVEGFEDEAFSESAGATRFELAEGEMGGGNGGWRWVVTNLDDDSVTFGPVEKARNSFRWERVSADEWRAVLEWPATVDKPARRRVYKMERWPRPADKKN